LWAALKTYIVFLHPTAPPQSNDDHYPTEAGSGSGSGSGSYVHTRIHRARDLTRRFFASRAKHWVILTLVILDVAGILTDIFIALITCEINREDEPWVAPTRKALTSFSLVMSCVFMVELGLSVFADGVA
jgi:hypothetical protein